MRSQCHSRHRIITAVVTALLIGAWADSASLALAQTNKKPAQAKSPSAAKVDVNSADLKTLETLPGVGPTLGQRIIDGRPYKNFDDLGKVKGMSTAKINNLQNEVKFGSTTASKKSSTKTKTAKSSTPTEKETTTAATQKASKQSSTASSSSSEEEQPLTPTGKSSGSSSASKKLASGQRIDINHASQEELESLPGIGPTKAQAIIDYREQNGNFGSIEDIQKVKGIKSGEFSKIQDMITAH